MSRSGYVDNADSDWQLIMWRGQVTSAIRGKRGQAFLRELVEALDAMPEKKLVYYELKNDEGVCALGCVGERRGMNLQQLDPEDWDSLAREFDIAVPLVREIEFINDEVSEYKPTSESRWRHVRAWAASQIKPEKETRP